MWLKKATTKPTSLKSTGLGKENRQKLGKKVITKTYVINDPLDQTIVPTGGDFCFISKSWNGRTDVQTDGHVWKY